VSTPNMETEDDVLKKPLSTLEDVMIYSNSICESTDLYRILFVCTAIFDVDISSLE